MACVTNKPVKLAKGLLDALELSSYFQVVLGGDSLPERKPHPLPLLHCMESLKISASQSLMIGDSEIMILKLHAVLELIVLWLAMAIIMERISMIANLSKLLIVLLS